MRDIDVRVAVRQSLADRHLGDNETLILEEMGVWSGSVRIDIAVINGLMHGLNSKAQRTRSKDFRRKPACTTKFLIVSRWS